MIISIVSSVWSRLRLGIQLAATAASDSSLSTFSLDPGYRRTSIISPRTFKALASFSTSSWQRLWLSCLYLILTLSFSIFHTLPASSYPNPSITATFHLDLSDISSLGANFPFCCRKWDESSPFGIGHTVGRRLYSCLLFDLLFKWCRLFPSIWLKSKLHKKQKKKPPHRSKVSQAVMIKIQ